MHGGEHAAIRGASVLLQWTFPHTGDGEHGESVGSRSGLALEPGGSRRGQAVEEAPSPCALRGPGSMKLS